ncbi:MAG: FG-GAP repeat protein [Anaerolineaceae bacterium]|jgi:hypothetical protein
MNASLRVLRFFLFILLCITNLSSMRFSSLVMVDSTLRRISAWHSRENPSLVFPVQRAWIGTEELCLHLADGSAEVKSCIPGIAEEIWRSPADWQVQEAFFSDLDGDGVQELALLVWRAFEPWPVDRFMPQGGRIDSFHDAAGNSCHLVLVSLEDGNPRELWAGSALAKPIHSLAVADLDGDGHQELAAIEYDYDGDATTGAVVVWAWSGFGFSLVDREKGGYTSLQVMKTDSSVILLALIE